jgi:hypothetical protein
MPKVPAPPAIEESDLIERILAGGRLERQELKKQGDCVRLLEMKEKKTSCRKGRIWIAFYQVHRKHGIF